MLTNLANYLNNDFPFHMFFAVQILLAEGLFVVRMKSRLRPLKIVLPVVLCYLVLAWFHPLLGHRFARVAAFFDEVEQEIQRYEYTFHTGNAALDSVLSEKSLYCSANHILLTTMLDASLLAPIEKSDIYSIFGNALDNAIQAVMAEAPENRSVNIRVSDVVGMTQIVFENFCSKPPEMHEGLPKTEKDTQYHGFGLRSIRYIIEKYDGHMSIDTKDQMFILSLLLPRPQQSA